MPDNFNTPCDGIIGKDFAKLYSGIINYGNNTFKIQTNWGSETIPIKSYTRGNQVK